MLSHYKHIVILLFFTSSLAAQSGSSVQDTDMLEKNIIVLKEDYPHVFKSVQIKNVKPISDKHSLVSYMMADDYYEAVVNSNRKDLLLIATCKQIRLDNLPDLIKDSFRNSDYGSGEIARAFEVTTPSSSVFYRLDAYTPGTIGQDKSPQLTSYFFDKLGHYKTPPY